MVTKPKVSDPLPPTTPPTNPIGQEPRWKLFLRWVWKLIRWAAVLAILAFGALSAWRGTLEVCKDTALVANNVVVIEPTCGGATATDAVVIIGGVAILLLILPDMQEAGAFGFSLKRKVVEQAKKQKALDQKLDLLSVRVDTAASATATASIQVEKLVLAEQVLAAPAAVAAKAGVFALEGEGLQYLLMQDAVATVEAVETPENAVAKQNLIRTWERVEFAMAALPSAASRRFQAVFADELRAVRAARNAVAHAQPIATAPMEAALEAGRELLRVAESPPPE